MAVETLQVIVSGLIQGVGFRPFVYRIALRHGLSGWVQNTNENVRIRVSGKPADISDFLVALEKEAPSAASIETIVTSDLPSESFTGFSILKSHDISDDVTEISPDIGVCSECLDDIKKGKRREGYSFVNCTNCGPRFTIIEDLPYDRPKTTMKQFELCDACRAEYEDILDRRFHAQPVACAECGPRYEMDAGCGMQDEGDKMQDAGCKMQDEGCGMQDAGCGMQDAGCGMQDAGDKMQDEGCKMQDAGDRMQDAGCKMQDEGDIPEMVARLLDEGKIVAIKGLGGMHLACDAFSEKAVARLREIKNREAKPFAVMFANLKSAKEFAFIDEASGASLLSWRRPIVLLEGKPGNGPLKLASNISSGLSLIGIMLPYMPFHYQLFEVMKTRAIVLTSGNLSDEPILIDNTKALEQFSSLANAVVLHNRDIYNRTDDSVVRIIGGKERVFRRSRGYVPSPVRLGLETEGILAFGAELTNCFCVGKGHKAFLSQHIGDLKGLDTTLFYEETLERFIRLFRVKPSLLAVDLHPDYISTRTAEGFGKLTIIQVQHHHAHIASCMAEHRLDETVIGVAFDGTGYGDDGHSWGSEFFICDLNGYRRMTHFGYLPLPGGDAGSEEPWRMAVSWLYKVYQREFTSLDLPVIKENKAEDIEMLIMMMDRKINSPLTSGAGRMFDAVASLLGLCQFARFQAQGPMLLESLAAKDCTEAYPWTGGDVICLDDTLKGIVADLGAGVEKSIIASKFHNTVISIIFETVKGIRSGEGINKVVLSGGVFQNKYLLEGTESLLRESKFEVFSHAAVPSNDGGIALGQLAVAAKKRELKCV